MMKSHGEVDWAEMAPDATVAEPGEWRVRRPGILIALADGQAQADLAEFLHCQGFNVWPVGSGVEAIATYLEYASSVDLLYLDAELPDLPGPAFLSRFKVHFPGVPCIFRARETGAVTEGLKAAGATIVPATLNRIELADRLWEVVAFEFLAEI